MPLGKGYVLSKKKTMQQRIQDWDGTKKLSVREYAAMKRMEAQTTKQVQLALRQQRESVLVKPQQTVVYVRPA